MHFSFGRRTVAGGEDQTAKKKFPRLRSLFGRKSKKNGAEHGSTASSHPGDISSRWTSPDPSQNGPVKDYTPSSNPTRRHSPAQLNTRTPVTDFYEADIYSRSPGSDSILEFALEDGRHSRPSCCPGFYEEGCESEETPTFKALNSFELASATSTITSPLSNDQCVSHSSWEPTPISAISLFSPASFAFTKTFTRPSHRMTLSMEPIPEEIEAEEIFVHDTPELEFAVGNDLFSRPSCTPGFYEEDCQSEELSTFETFNSSEIISTTSAVTPPPSVGHVAAHEFSPAALSFTKTFARPSQGMTSFMESISEEIETEDISTHGTPCTTPSSRPKHPSAETATTPTSSIRSISAQSSYESEPSILNFKTLWDDSLLSEGQKETATLDCNPKGLGLSIPSAATSPNGIIQLSPQLESISSDQFARLLSPIAGSSESSPNPPRPSLSSSASPPPSSALEFSSPHRETALISPEPNANEERSRCPSSESEMSSKDCLKNLDRWSLELEILQEKFQSLTSTTPMEALLGALFPEEYPHFARTSPSFTRNSSATQVDIFCGSPAPTPSSAYLLPEPLASSPSMSDAGSDNLSEECIETPSASDWQDHWKSRVSMCDIREVARRENERLERLGPQHSIAEELRLRDIVELSLHAL
ncbi:hypothetical protein FRB97_007280 [Tulasnella sp. 331]|nr:hypothetical protein FRB97_007280 [Tulasnella sp. 331]KAG8876773.1 hypothetical protein FRB98_007037 [Tulasnella sp. 332]